MHTNKLLYFSLDKEARTLFHQYAEKSRAVYKHSFQLVDKKSELCEYSHASDLMVILENVERRDETDHLFVIIDYLSLCATNGKSAEEYDSLQSAADIIRRAIIKYPDILFLFDESGAVMKNESGNIIPAKYDFLDFLFDCRDIKSICKKESMSLRKELHQFNVRDNSDPFFFISRDRDNLFDGSNLRWCVKKALYDTIRVERENFRFIQDSRANHLAFCVEKESSQNKFNSYALYANGFRVTQVLSAEELKYLNGQLKDKVQKDGKSETVEPTNDEAIKEFIKPDIVVRDFDLQFNDINTSIKKESYSTPNSSQITFNINEIDKIRGAKFFDNESYRLENNTEEANKSKEVVNDSCLNKWRIIEERNPYWSSFINVPFYYVMAEEEAISIIKENKTSSENPLFLGLKDSTEFQNLPGIIKPVSGLYSSFRRFAEVQERVISLRKKEKEAKEGTETIVGQEPKEEMKKEKYSISRKRKNHDHSKPLDVYDLAKSMVQRALKCYNNENYVRAAVIASEAIEVMNGFHLSLTIEAYGIKAKAENAIAIDIFGGSEKELCKDACVRIDMIKKDIARLLSANKEQSINVLSQIFSDCRNYCKEKEHFESEDVFIAALAEQNEGITLNTCNNLKAFIKSVINRHKEHFKDLKHCIIEEIKSYETESKTDGTGIGKEGAGEGEKEQE